MCFDLNKFVFSLEKDRNKFDEDTLNKLELLCRKIDVVGKLFIQYNHNLSKKTSEIEIKSNIYLLLHNIFVRAFNQNHDYKYLNTLFKFNDLNLNKNLIDKEHHSKRQEELVEMFYLINR